MCAGEICEERQPAAAGQLPTHGEGVALDGVHRAGIAANAREPWYHMLETRRDETLHELCPFGHCWREHRRGEGRARVRVGNEVFGAAFSERMIVAELVVPSFAHGLGKVAGKVGEEVKWTLLAIFLAHEEKRDMG